MDFFVFCSKVNNLGGARLFHNLGVPRLWGALSNVGGPPRPMRGRLNVADGSSSAPFFHGERKAKDLTQLS
jgi:hypothetical protein